MFFPKPFGSFAAGHVARYALISISGSVVLATPLGLRAQQTDSHLDEIVVTGNILEMPRRRLGTAVSVISGSEMQLRGYDSLADVLRTQPAIGVSNFGGIGKTTTLRVRGEEGYRTLLMIDGVKALDASAPQVSPSFDSLLSTGDLQRVEVLRGPQGFIYGADAGGVVNVITRTGAGPFAGRIGFEGGEFGTRTFDASAAGGGDVGDYYIAVTDLETDGFNARPSDDVLIDDDGADNTTVHAKLGWNASDNLRVQFVARDIDASTRFDGCFHPVDFIIVNECSSTNEHTTYRLSAEHSAGQLSNRFGYSEVDIKRGDFAGAISSFATSGTLGRLEYTGSYQPNDVTTFVYGLDLQTEDIVSGGTADERNQDGYYFEYQGEFNEAFYLTLGTRYDDNDDFGSATSTRVSAAYVQALGSGRTLKYRASYGTGFRPPSIFEVGYNSRPGVFPPASDVTLVEEKSKGYDLGIEYDTVNGLHFEVTYFDQEIENAIEFDLVSFSGYLQDSGVSTSKGIEIATRVPLGERLELLANLTHNDTKDPNGDPRLRRPELLANFGVSYTTSDDSLSFIANLRASRDAVEVGFGVLDDY